MSLLKPASTAWLLAHEMRLTWRGFRGGRMGKAGSLVAFGVLGLMLL
ncbi:MAG: hypothetical protein JWR84_1988, partial [Caulobacter sp.]|nr:hypothetical protein [Caulobacter sp.]